MSSDRRKRNPSNTRSGSNASLPGNPVSPLMLTLSTHIAAAARRALSPEVTARAKTHMLDTFAAMVAGSKLLPGKRASTYVRPLNGVPVAGVIGTRLVTSSQYAALANGMCGHAAETDDTHPPSRTHPGTSVIPAALAIAEQHDRSGRELLRCIALGYDICARTILALAPTPAQRPACANGAFGHLFGAVSSAAALLHLDARKTRFALAYAGQQASGLYTRLRDSEHIEKAYAVGGMPAHNAVLAATMVRSGFTGVDDVFSGEDNFFATYAPNADVEAMVRDLGKTHEIMRGGIKRWCVGGPAQAPLDVIHTLMQQHGFRARDVASVVVRIPATELQIVNNRDMPNISLQHLLAVMLVDGTLTFASARDARRMKDARVIRLRELIKAVGDPSIPNTVRGWRCGMDITLKDGRRLTHSTMAAKGSHENPMMLDEVEVKARGLMEPVLGKRRSALLIEALADIERLSSVRSLRELYCA